MQTHTYVNKYFIFFAIYFERVCQFFSHNYLPLAKHCLPAHGERSKQNSFCYIEASGEFSCWKASPLLHAPKSEYKSLTPTKRKHCNIPEPLSPALEKKIYLVPKTPSKTHFSTTRTPHPLFGSLKPPPLPSRAPSAFSRDLPASHMKIKSPKP